MTAETKTSVAARFATYAFPTATDFATLVSSYANFSDTMEAIASAAGAGSKGLVYVSGASAVTFYSAASQGLRIANTATTAAAVSILGAGTAGAGVFAASTTAAAQQSLAGGTVGRAIFETSTTAAAVSILGSVSAATQAETEGITSNAVVVTPFNAKWLPQVAKAWAIVSAGGNPVDIKASHGIATVSSMATGLYNVVFSTVMSSQNYAITGTVSHNGTLRFFNTNSAATVSAGGFQTRIVDAGGTDANPERFHISVFGDI